MRVTLNGSPFDMTLEREKTLGEVLAGIEEWLRASRFSLSGLSVDGRAVPPDGIEGICAVEVDEVETLELSAATWSDLYLGALAECGALVDAALQERRSARESGRTPAVAEIAARFRESASSSFLAANSDALGASVAAALSGETPDPDADLERVGAEIKGRAAEVRNPLEALEAALVSIPSLAGRLEELPLDLQTGKDVQAALSLGDLALVMEKLLRLIPLMKEAGFDLEETVIDGAPFSGYFEDMNAALKELTAGYGNGDAILVGDLAEYEIAPRLRRLEEAFAAVLREVKK